MNEENLNLEIRKFLKKVGITSQKVIENYITKSDFVKAVESCFSVI